MKYPTYSPARAIGTAYIDLVGVRVREGEFIHIRLPSGGAIQVDVPVDEPPVVSLPANTIVRHWDSSEDDEIITCNKRDLIELLQTTIARGDSLGPFESDDEYREWLIMLGGEERE